MKSLWRRRFEKANYHVCNRLRRSQTRCSEVALVFRSNKAFSIYLLLPFGVLSMSHFISLISEQVSRCISPCRRSLLCRLPERQCYRHVYISLASSSVFSFSILARVGMIIGMTDHETAQVEFSLVVYRKSAFLEFRKSSHLCISALFRSVSCFSIFTASL